MGSRVRAAHLVDSIDQGRAAFIRHYFGTEWPNRHLYHIMVNTVIGLEATVDLLLQTLQAVDQTEETRVDLE